MTEATASVKTGTGRRPPAPVMQAINILPGLILRSPIHGLMSKKVMLLTFTGRRSGKRYTSPVAYVQAGETVLAGTERPWAQNLRGGAHVGVRLRGEHRSGVADVIDDEAGMSEGYATILKADPGYARFVGVTLGPDDRPDAAAVVRARQRGLVVIRIHLDPKVPEGADG